VYIQYAILTYRKGENEMKNNQVNFRTSDRVLKMLDDLVELYEIEEGMCHEPAPYDWNRTRVIEWLVVQDWKQRYGIN